MRASMLMLSWAIFTECTSIDMRSYGISRSVFLKQKDDYILVVLPAPFTIQVLGFAAGLNLVIHPVVPRLDL